MAMPTLFRRTDIVSTLYTAVPENGCHHVAEGDRLEGHSSTDGTCVLLVNGHACVGRIEGEGAKDLLAALREPGNPGVTPVKVTSVSPVSAFFKVEIAKEGGEHGKEAQ